MARVGGKLEIEVDPNVDAFPGKLAGALRRTTGIANAAGKGIAVAIAAGTVAAGLGFTAVIDKGIQYQGKLNELQSVTQATAVQMAAAGKVAKDLGSDMTLPATSAADAAAAMDELAKGGLNVDQAMRAAEGTLQLAAAAQTDAASAAEIESNTLNAFALSADNAGRVADVLANTSNAAAGSITDIGNSLKYVAPISAALKISLEDTAAAIGLLANQGIQGEQAGTSLRGILASLSSPSLAAAKALKVLGVQAFDNQGKFVGLRTFTDQLSKAKKRLTDAEFAAAASTAFGNEGLTAANALAAEGAASFDQMATAVSRTGGAADVAAAKTKGLGGAIEGFKSQVETTGLEVYEVIAPNLEKVVRAGASMVDRFTPTVVSGLRHVVAAGEVFGPDLAKAVQSRASALVHVADEVVGPLRDGVVEVLTDAVNLGETAVGGFTGVVRDAAQAVHPLAVGVGDLAESLDKTGGPIGVVRTGLELTYKAAQGTITVLAPLLDLAGGLVSEFSALPGPIQSTALAVLALRVGPSVIGGLRSSLSGAGKEAEDASRKTGLFSRVAGTVLAPVNAVTTGVSGAATVLRRFNDEARVQQAVAGQAGQQVGRLAGAAGALNTSTIPAVQALRRLREEADILQSAAGGVGQEMSRMAAYISLAGQRLPVLGAMASSFDKASSQVRRSTDEFALSSGVAVESLGTKIPNAVRATVGAVTGLPGKIGSGLSAAKTAITTFGVATAVTVLETGDKITALPGKVSSGFTSTGRAIAERAASIVSAVQSIPTGIGVAAINAGEKASQLGSAVSTRLSGALDVIKALPTAVGVGTITVLEKIPVAATNAVSALGKLGGIAAGAAAAVGTGLSRAASGLVSALGGPFGIAVAGAAVGLSILASKQEAAAQAAAKHEAGTNKLADSLRDAGKSADEVARRSIGESLVNDYKNAADAAKGFGISLDQVTDAAAGNKVAQQAIFDQVRHFAEDDPMSKQGQDAFTLMSTIADLNHQYGDAVEKNNRLKEAIANGTASMLDATDSGRTFAAAIAVLRDNTSSADSKIRALKDGLDALSGGSIDLESAQAHLNESFDNLTSLFDADALAGKGFVATLITADGKFNIATAAGRNFRDGLQDITTQAIEVAQRTFDMTGSVDDAKAVIETAREKFIATADSMHIGAKEAGVLADSMNLVPDKVATLIEAPGMTESQQEWVLLKEKINAVPQGKTVTVTSLSDEAKHKLEDIGFTVTHLPNGSFAVVANTASANESLNSIVRQWNGYTIVLKAVVGGVGANLRAQVLNYAAGGIVQGYASGAIRQLTPMSGKIAQRVDPNTWRVIGDRLRGKEYFLPDDSSPRTLAIGAEWARNRGLVLMKRYASGGIAMATQARAAAPVAPGGLTINNNVTVRDNDDAYVVAAVTSEKLAFRSRLK